MKKKDIDFFQIILNLWLCCVLLPVHLIVFSTDAKNEMFSVLGILLFWYSILLFIFRITNYFLRLSECWKNLINQFKRKKSDLFETNLDVFQPWQRYTTNLTWWFWFCTYVPFLVLIVHKNIINICNLLVDTWLW